MEVPKGKYIYTVPATALIPPEVGINFLLSARSYLEQKERGHNWRSSWANMGGMFGDSTLWSEKWGLEVGSDS